VRPLGTPAKRLADSNGAMTLEQFCRVLAAHLLLGSHPELLHSVMAPETAERTAEIIHRFALGEQMARSTAKLDGVG